MLSTVDRSNDFEGNNNCLIKFTLRKSLLMAVEEEVVRNGSSFTLVIKVKTTGFSSIMQIYEVLVK